MSEESTTPNLVELVGKAFEAGKRRDFDAMMSYYAPHAVLDAEAAVVGPFEGRAAIRAFYEDWIGAYDDLVLEVEERRYLDGGVVFAVLVQRGRMPGTASWVTFRDASVMIWNDGLIERITRYLDIDQARAAAERLAQERE